MTISMAATERWEIEQYRKRSASHCELAKGFPRDYIVAEGVRSHDAKTLRIALPYFTRLRDFGATLDDPDPHRIVEWLNAV